MAATATHHDDHHHAPATLPDATVNVRPVMIASVAALAVGAALYLGGGVANTAADPDHGIRDFFLAYLCGFIFWCSLPFGALLLSMVGSLAQATWATIFRRIFQASLATLPLMLVLGLPVVASLFVLDGKQSPYWWSDGMWYKPTDEITKGFNKGEGINEDQKTAVAKFVKQGYGHDEKDVERNATIAVAEGKNPTFAEEAQHKIKDWLNPGGFAVRYVLYFAVIGVLAFVVYRQGRKVEEGDDTAKGRSVMQHISGPGVPILVLTLTLFVTDWVMSVEESWSSSMFPVVFGFNTILTTLAFSTLVFYSLTKVPNDPWKGGAARPDLTAIMKYKFRIDIGSLCFGFCMAWAYASFCQFMLIWAGNLPEEIGYYLKRGANTADTVLDPNKPGNSGWIWLSLALMLCHWLIPFIVLLFREVKTSPRGMRVMACLFLTVCALDVIWWIVPSVPHDKTWMHMPMAIGAILGVGGIWGLAFGWQLGKRPILAKNSDVQAMAEWGHH